MGLRPRVLMFRGCSNCSQIQQRGLHQRPYLAKWRHFSTWTQQNQLSSETVDIPELTTSSSLSTLGLSTRSLGVHLAVVRVIYPLVESYSIFTHPTKIRFLKGFIRKFLPVVKQTSQWDISL
ncbi:hypothetical protein KIL84_011764, partial [Mauremys mutica]